MSLWIGIPALIVSAVLIGTGIVVLAVNILSSDLSRQEERERFAGPATRQRPDREAVTPTGRRGDAGSTPAGAGQLRARQRVLDALADMDRERDARD